MANKTCSVQGCDAPHYARGWCGKHYKRWNVHGDPMADHRREFDPQVCLVDGCVNMTSPGSARGMCNMHYKRLRSDGDAGEAATRMPTRGLPLAERFWSKVDKAGPVPAIGPRFGPCWLWTAAQFRDGYGQFQYATRKLRGAHRVSYELAVGPIPDGLTLDHLCRVRHCVRPEHLEPVTIAVNIGRAAPANKDTCKRGHDLTDPANLKPNSRGARQCRACSNLSRAERYKRLGR